MWTVVHALFIFTAALGMLVFCVGGLAVSSWRLRQRLPVQSPVSLMHAGSSLFGLGFFGNLAALVVRSLL